MIAVSGVYDQGGWTAAPLRAMTPLDMVVDEAHDESDCGSRERHSQR
jgi:hypothetical protein